MKLGSADISKVYLGATEVTKAYLGSVEVYSSAPEPLPEYISDGLVLWLDGKVKGNTTDAWTDLVNGVVFTKKGSGVTFNSDNVQFGGSSNNCLYNTSTTDFGTSTSCTIEVCYRDIPTSGTKAAFYSYGTGGTALCFQFTGGNRVVINAGNASARPYNGAWTAETTGTYSISAARAYQNGVSKGFTGDKTYISRTAAASIIGASGRGASTYYDALGGKMHSLRIYNRQLTEEEVLHNQAIDNTRFNLGLTINS